MLRERGRPKEPSLVYTAVLISMIWPPEIFIQLQDGDSDDDMAGAMLFQKKRVAAEKDVRLTGGLCSSFCISTRAPQSISAPIGPT